MQIACVCVLTFVSARNSKYLYAFFVSDDVDSGRGTSDRPYSADSKDSQQPVIDVKVTQDVRQKTKKPHLKIHYSLIDTPYASLPLKNIHSKLVSGSSSFIAQWIYRPQRNQYAVQLPGETRNMFLLGGLVKLPWARNIMYVAQVPLGLNALLQD